VGLFYGTVFYQLDTGKACDESCYQDRMSLLYFGMLLMLMGQLDNLPILIDDRLIYYREHGAKAYSPLAYYLSTFLLQLPLMAVNVLCYSLCMYPMTGLRAGARHYAYFFFFMLFSCYCSMLMTYTCAALAKTTEVALGYFPAPFAFNLLYAGYLVFIPAMEDWQKVWMPYLSYFRFAFQGLVLNEFQNNDDLPDSHFFIQRLGFNFISVEGCAGVLLIFLGFFAVTYYLAIRFVDFEER
jgi:ABC-type multidrug transport system permease subunit